MAHICQQTVNNEIVLETRIPEITLAVYRCGGCNAMFETICVLHAHMQSHDAGGSYHYDHSFLTAFPKYGNMCTASQTDIVLSSCAGIQPDSNGKAINDFCFHQSNICNIYASSQDCTNDSSEFKDESDDVKVEVETYVESECQVNKKVGSSDAKDEVVEIGNEISKTGEKGVIKVEKTDKTITENIDGANRETTVHTGDANCDNVSNNQNSPNDTDVEEHDPEYELPIERKPRNGKATSIKVAFGKTKERNRISRNKSDFPINEKQFKRCQVCQKSLCSSSALKRHMSVVHSEESTEKVMASYQCKYCNFRLKSKTELQKHVREVHNETCRNISCPYCEKEFLKSSTKSQHIDEEHPEIANVLKKFHQSKDNDLQTACELCGKLFSTAAGLALHMSSFHLKKRFKCDICNVELSQKFTLKAHKIEKHHEDMRGFDCNICKKTFAYKFRLKAHIEQMHTSSEEINNKYICETCGYFSKSKAGLRYHLTKHDVQRKQYQCEVCPYKTYYKCSMTEHTSSHQGNRRFVCDACGDKFFTSKQLKVHMRRHTGEMPYQCEMCNKRFRTDIAYARHKDIHLNKMRFKCEYCEKEFVQKTNCLAHMRQHTGEKPFKCDWCGQRFTHNVSRKNHMNKCSKKPS